MRREVSKVRRPQVLHRPQGWGKISIQLATLLVPMMNRNHFYKLVSRFHASRIESVGYAFLLYVNVGYHPCSKIRKWFQ